MLHKIVLTPSIDGTDYLKSLAGLDVNPSTTFGVRYFSTLELAKYLLQLNGITCPKTFVTNLALSARLYQKTKEIPYFKNYSFSDVFELIKSLNKLRECISLDESNNIKKLLEVDSFKRKNYAVISFYELLKEELDSNNLIDEIGLIRYAVSNSSPIEDVEFIRYCEFDYSNLAVTLLNTASGKEVIPTHLFSSDKPKISSYTKAFSQNSEIEDILAYIYQNNIKFDECVIAASDTNTYGKILSNYQGVLHFPLVVNSGQSILDTSCGRLFGYIDTWEKSHNHYKYLCDLLNASEFNLEKFKSDIGYDEKFISQINFDLALSNYDVLDINLIIKVVGNLKLGLFDFELNQERLDEYEELVKSHLFKEPTNPIYKRDAFALEHVKKINNIFSKGLLDFVGAYLIINKDNESIENNAYEKFYNVLSLAKVYNVPYQEAIKFLNSVVVGFRKPVEGSLFLTSISNSISYLRKHLFIVGLDSKTFPGNVKEDPTILDQDYKLFGIEDASSKNIKDNKNLYHDLISLASSLDINIHLSYAYYNSETAKEQNASSVLFETYKKENGENKTVNDLNNEFNDKSQLKYRITGFFDVDLFPLSVIGKNIKNGVVINSEEIKESESQEIDAKRLLSSKGLSATAISKYIECEYKFFLNVLLRIDQEDDIDIYQIISPVEVGNLAHELLENFDLTDSIEEFRGKVLDKFREYLICHPTDNLEAALDVEDDFLGMMENGYEMEVEEGTPSVLREEDIYTIHEPSGLKIHGFPDKVTKLSDGTYRVIDYKTGNSIRHDVDKVESMIQGALYSYIITNGKNKLNYYGNKKIRVSEFVFRYLKNKINISSYDKDHDIQIYLDYLDEVLLKIAESIKTGKFEKNGDCDKCFYRSVCGGRKA